MAILVINFHRKCRATDDIIRIGFMRIIHMDKNRDGSSNATEENNTKMIDKFSVVFPVNSCKYCDMVCVL